VHPLNEISLSKFASMISTPRKIR